MSRETTTAFAPASVGNVAAGYDILGHALEGPGDRVTARRLDPPGVVIEGITGVITDLPDDPHRNTAGAAVLCLLERARPEFGIGLSIDKGIPLGSGLGGSAASATAALIAANALLDPPLPLAELYQCALAGEAVASGGRHGDNVGPQLIGGLALATRERLVPVPVPAGLTAAAVHPHLEIATRDARAVLAEPYPLTDFVAQSGHLALLLAGCFRGDMDLIHAGLADVLVEPRRAPLIPGFRAVREAALDHGALGASISGAGPTVFAWFPEPGPARAGAEAMREAFAQAGHAADTRISRVDAPAAGLLREPA